MTESPATKHRLRWVLAPFDELTSRQLYDALQLRTDVFALEQECVFQDMDGADHLAVHLLGKDADAPHAPDAPLIAYARMFPAGIKFTEASIGRVVTRTSERGKGYGHLLIVEALRALCATWGPQPVRIGAQARLRDYYVQHGFVDMGIPYIEDGIDHIEMLWTPS